MSLDPDVEISVVVEPVTTVEVFASQVGPSGPQWQGSWSPLITYYPTDLVTRDGSVWIATAENTGVDPAADASSTVIGSLVGATMTALGSPSTVATSFTVDRDSHVVALSMAQAYTATPDGDAGIAEAINVPGVGTVMITSGVPAPNGRINLDNPVILSANVKYWLVMHSPGARINIDQGPELAGTHMAWGGDFWYGSTEPSTDFHGVYGVPVVLYGTTADDAWQLYLQGTP